MARGPLRLGPRQRDRLRERAKRQAGREMRAPRRQAGREIQRRQAQGQRESKSARGVGRRSAQHFRQAAANIGPGVATPGLVQRQLGQQAASHQRFGQGLARLSDRAAQADVRGIRQGLRQQQAGAVRSSLSQLVQQAREQKAKQLEKRQENQTMKRETQAAIQRGQKLISQIPVHELPAAHDPGFRDKLSTQIARVEGIGSTAAKRATRRLYRELLEQIGGPATGRTPTELGQTTLTTQDLLRRR